MNDKVSNDKKWPVPGQIFIALGFLSSFAAIMNTLDSGGILGAIIGVFSVIVWWQIYQFKDLARGWLNLLMVFKIFFNFIVLFKGVPFLFCLSGMIYAAVNLKYFNSSDIKALFEKQ